MRGEVGKQLNLTLNRSLGDAVDPLAWTTDVLTKLVNRWPASRIHSLGLRRQARIGHGQCGTERPLTVKGSCA
jgi:hypothetical protein